MATKGRARYVGEAIESIRQQSFRNWRMLVIYAPSDDGALEVLRTHARADKRIRLEAEAAPGFAHAINQGIARANTPFVTFQESDDVSHPERLAACLAALRAHPKADVIIPYWLIFDTESHLPAEQFHPGFIMSCFRTATLRRMGPFRPFFVSMSDVDMKWRMDDDKQVCTIIVPQLLYFKRHHAGTQEHLYLRGHLSMERLAMCYSRWCRLNGQTSALAWNFARNELLDAIRLLPKSEQARLHRETIRQMKKHLSYAYDYAFSAEITRRLLTDLRNTLRQVDWTNRQIAPALLRLRLAAFSSWQMRRARLALRRTRKAGWRSPMQPIADYMRKPPWNTQAR